MDFLRNLLPANLERYLRGIDFLIGKQELLRRLEYNGAPSVVVNQVRNRHLCRARLRGHSLPGDARDRRTRSFAPPPAW